MTLERSTGDEAGDVLDGRVARGLRTRMAILDAYAELIADAELPPTAAELAARAGVSPRSIFTHFGDMDGVLAEAGRRAFDWVVEGHVNIPPELPLDERLDRFVDRQVEILERTAPLYRVFRTVRMGTRRQKCAPAVLEVLGRVDRLRRRYLACVFDWELASAGALGETDLLEALMAVSSWGSWETLRIEQGLDEATAHRVMHRLLGSLVH